MNAAMLQTTSADDAVPYDYAAPFRSVFEVSFVPPPAASAFVPPDQSSDDAVECDYHAPFEPWAMRLDFSAWEFVVMPVAIPLPAAAPKAAKAPRQRRRDFAFVRVS